MGSWYLYRESTGFPEPRSRLSYASILLRVSICTVLVTVKRLREESYAYCATVDNSEFYSGVVGKNVVLVPGTVLVPFFEVVSSFSEQLFWLCLFFRSCVYAKM